MGRFVNWRGPAMSAEAHGWSDIELTCPAAITTRDDDEPVSSGKQIT